MNTNSETVTNVGTDRCATSPSSDKGAEPYRPFIGGTQLPCGVLVDSEETLDDLLHEVTKAAIAFSTYSQQQVDKIFDNCALVANQNRLGLAKMALDEAGMGVLEDKVIKNHFAAEAVHDAYKNTKTCGLISRDVAGGYSIYAEPIGLLAGIVPCTNPTSTTIFKSLLALKTRNCIVFSPHPRTAKCTIEAARLMRDAAVATGAPPNCIGWIDVASVKLCSVLMNHSLTKMIVATGAGALVKAAYSSGKPCMGGGAGNTPVVIDETADIPMAINSVILSKTFDHGMICASEQAVIAVEKVAENVKREFELRGGYFLKSDEEKQQLGSLLFNDNGMLNPVAVGQSAARLASLAGIGNAPESCQLLLAEIDSVGPTEKLSHEKLCPCLGFYVEKDYDAALARALELVQYGGMGHTSVLYTDLDGPLKEERVHKFESLMPTGRTLVCMPTSQGAIGGVFNFRQAPSLSLGCGSWGGNASAEGLQVKHLLNYKQISERRDHKMTFTMPPCVTFGRSISRDALEGLKALRVKRAFVVVSEEIRKESSCISVITTALEEMGIQQEVFVCVAATWSSITKGVAMMRNCEPDCVIALGGLSVMESAKVLRLFYEHSDTSLDTLSTRFMDASKRVSQFPKKGGKIKTLVCFPTAASMGAEMTPFASVIVCRSGDRDEKWFHLLDESLTPDSVVIDYNFGNAGLREDESEMYILACLAMSIETYTSMMATDFSRSFSMQAIRQCVQKGREKMTSVAQRCMNLMGVALANAQAGILQSLARQLVANFRCISPQLAVLLLINQVIGFNADAAPTKQGTFPQYDHPMASEHYSEMGRLINGNCSFKDIQLHFTEMKPRAGVPLSIKDLGVLESEFVTKLDAMALAAFDDQPTGCNPRYPLVVELAQILMQAYYGKY